MSGEEESDDVIRRRSEDSLRPVLWFWSYAWSLALIGTMMLNMMVALMPSMMSDLNIPIVVMGSVLGVRRLVRLPAAWVAGFLGDKWERVARARRVRQEKR